MKLRGFTLIEILVSITIVAILAALLFPVFSSARDQSFQTTEIEQLRQVYVAWQLYEDTDGDAPLHLDQLRVGQGLPTAMLRAHRDVVRTTPTGDYPAKLFVHESPLRVPYRISFAYLRAFEGRFTSHTWEQLRAEPSVGVLASTWSMKDAACDRNWWHDDHGNATDSGVLLRVRMDGSLKIVPKSNEGCSVGGSFESLFLFHR